MKKLYLVDVSSMFFRAFFALPPMNNGKGLPTNALYGFLSMTTKLIREKKPDYMVFCFDRKEPSFRSELYAEYKANRNEMPEDLVPQIPYVHKITACLGVPAMDKVSFEADDIIGTLARFGEREKLDVVIVSGDKDFAQLVSPHVSMYDSMKEVMYNHDEVVAKWGIKPEQMIDYLALTGDSSDNIPGVKGVGPKSAQKLLHEYNTLDGVYENINKITGKALKANLENDKKMAYLSKDLVTIRTDVSLDVSLDQLKIKPYDPEPLRELLQELNFKNLARQIGVGADAPAKEGAKSKAVEVSTESAGEQQSLADTDANKVTPVKANRTVSNKKVVEVDCTLAELGQRLEPYSEVWLLLDERGFYLAKGDTVFKVAEDGKKIGQLLTEKKVSCQGFDLKAAWHYLGIDEPVASWDAQLAAYVIAPGSNMELKALYNKFCGEDLPDLMSPADLYRLQLKLHDVLESELKAKAGNFVYDKIEQPLLPVLYAMEKKGILLDTEELKRQSRELEKDIRALEEKIFALAGGQFNILSPKQLAQVLFGKLKLPPGKKTKTGFSTDSDVLQELAKEHPIALLLLDYRELTKLKSTYVDALPALVNPVDGRLHTHFSQVTAATGRLSSINPNLQNIPIRTERGRAVRRAFVAPPGQVLLSADYSQIELRILAHITGDEGLIRAFKDNIDIHTATAAEIYSVPLDKVTPELRRTAKAVNFGIAYGQGAFGLSETLGISRSEASDVIERYFKRYARVKTYMEDTVATAHRQGYVETLFGRRRYLEELKSKNGAIRKFGERAAINAPMQGTASDLVKMAMLKAHDSLTVPMLLQVHDELIFECPESQIEKQTEQIRQIMENVAKLHVPLKVNISTGWD